MGAITRLVDLSEQDRQSCEGWIEERVRGWRDDSLDCAVNELRSMPECAWRLVATALLVKADLKHQWQNGRRVTLEPYLEAYPELGGKGGVAAELILAEIRAKAKAGVSFDVKHYFQSYPNQADELRDLVAQSRSAATGSTQRMRPQTPRTPRPVSTPPADAAPTPPAVSPRTAKSVPTPRPATAASPSPPLSPPVVSQSALPEMFGRYRIEKQLGQGGMGSVYKAYDTELHRHVALKVPQFGPAEGAEVLERFKQEARAAATLRHTNLCQVYDVGAIDGTNFLTMEFIEGQSLEGYAAKEREVSQRFIALILTKLARALKAAHVKNVIHRDLKPSNIMLRDADGALEPVIVDFGLARRIDPGTARLTQSGLVIGTWQYMTAEQLCGEPDALGPSCDIYALGVIMYELLTSRLPYDAPGQVVRGNAAAPSSFRTGLDPRLEAICLKAMAPSRDARYASMGDLATALTDYLRGSTDKSPEVQAAIAPSGPLGRQHQPEEPSSAKVQEGRPPLRAPLIAGASAAVVAVLGGLFGLSIFTFRGPGKGEGTPPAADRSAFAKPASPAPTLVPASGPGKGEGAPPAADRSALAKPASPAPPLAPANIDSERLFDESRRAIREGRFTDAKEALYRYLAAPGSPKQTEARALLADLDHAPTQEEARLRAKGLTAFELELYTVPGTLGADSGGVNDLLAGIVNPELRETCKAILLDALRQERTARAMAKRDLAANAERLGPRGRDAPGMRPEAPRTAGSRTVPVRELEPGFSPIYNGRDFEGWGATYLRNLPPAKGGSGYFPCKPANVASRVGNSLVSNDVIGTLVTDKVYQFNSLRFNYKIVPYGRRPEPKAKTPRTAHTIAELVLGQPMAVGNNAQCGVIMISLAAADAGDVMTRRKRDARETGTHVAQTRAGRPPGEWNEMEIKCSDTSVSILLNGVEVNRLEVHRRFNAKVLFSFGGIELQLADIRLARHG